MPPLRFRYQTIEFGEIDIHLRTLRDNQQFVDTDDVAANLGICSAAWPMFGVVWVSGEVLAHLMSDFSIAGKRILEVGCGIGLASLVLNNRHADITATDHHPEAGTFLTENTRLNNGPSIPFVRTGWTDEESNLGDFDLIIGSDLLYEADHALLLATFINQHALPTCEVIIVDPGRGHSNRFGRQMVELGYVEGGQHEIVDTELLSRPFRGRILQYSRQAPLQG